MNGNILLVETLDLIKYVMEKGITTFDHADIYGSYTCEALFGEALALEPSMREKMEIVTKCESYFNPQTVQAINRIIIIQVNLILLPLLSNHSKIFRLIT